MPRAVIDAAFALSSVLPDEVGGLTQQRILSAFRAGELTLLAPSVWEYEVANALCTAVARGRLTEHGATIALDSLLGYGIELYEFSAIAHRAWELALKHRLTVYDAAYLALAEQGACPLYTGDKRLAEVARREGLVENSGDVD